MSHDEDVAKPAAPAAATQEPSLLESLLDPHRLQQLMTFGAGLLVTGLVIWMWAIGIFENKLAMATGLGAITLGMLAGGWSLLKFTRYQIAGKAITLLACTVMPLNLWFYHAQHLVTLEGHLWVAGVVCCALYAISALTLRQPVFVNVTMLGVTMTGLLILADEHVQKLWEIAAPSTLLVIIGLIGIHIERAFPPEGDFSRKSFGRAFFQSGIIALTAGLMLLFGAQLAAWASEPAIYFFGMREAPAIGESHSLQLLALCLVVAGAYAYMYADWAVRRSSAFLFAAAFNLIWAEVLAIKLLAIHINEEVAIAVLAITALGVNVLQAYASRAHENSPAGSDETKGGSLARGGYVLGLFISTIPLVIGFELHLRATYRFVYDAWPFTLGVTYASVMAITAVSARAGAHIYRKQRPMLSETYFFATAAATLMFARGVLALCGIQSAEVVAPCLMLIPIAYLIASRINRDSTSERPLARVAQMATAFLLASVVAASIHLVPERVYDAVRGHSTNLLLSVFFGEAAIFYVLAALFRKKDGHLYMATATACGAVWQLLNYWSLPEEYFTLVFAVAGLALIISERFLIKKEGATSPATHPAAQCGHTLLSMSFVAAILLTMSRLLVASANIHFPLLVLLILLSGCSMIAAWLSRDPSIRSWYAVTTFTEVGLTFLVLNVLSTLRFWDKMEFFCVAVGVFFLTMGHLRWYRERANKSLDDWTSMCLGMGSVFASFPCIFAVLIQRGGSSSHWTTMRLVNEVGILAMGLALVGTGTLFKLRSKLSLAGSRCLCTCSACSSSSGCRKNFKRLPST